MAHSIKRMPLVELKPAGYNPRTISDKALAGLTKSFERFGLVQPIIWNRKTKHVVGGHQRLKVLLAKGEKECDVVVVSLSLSEEKALNVALNSPEIGGEFTADLDALLAEIAEGTPELYDELLLDELRAPEEEPPDTSEQMEELEHRIIVDCDTEKHQAELLERFEKEGLACRVLIS